MTSPDPAVEGRALVTELLGRRPPESTEVLGLLKTRPPEGAMIEVPIKMSVRVVENGWHDLYETQPVQDRPGEVLVVQHQAGRTNEYRYGRYDGRNRDALRLLPVSGTNLFQPLAGSEFFLADLGLEFLHWPSQKIVKREMRKGRSCRVVESLNPHHPAGPYARVLSWLDFETGNIIRAEAYDERGVLLKEFSVRKISREAGKVQLKEIEIRNDQTDTRTRLEFNFELAE